MGLIRIEFASTVYEGQSFANKAHGFGRAIFADSYYEGFFDEDLFQGQGKRVWWTAAADGGEETTVVEEGKWSKG